MFVTGGKPSVFFGQNYLEYKDEASLAGLTIAYNRAKIRLLCWYCNLTYKPVFRS
jgi:hypothetical protein